jgi:hypothetical protein
MTVRMLAERSMLHFGTEGGNWEGYVGGKSPRMPTLSR